MKVSYIGAGILGCATLLASCGGTPQFNVKGEVEGGAGKTLVLEKSDFHGNWIILDSVKVKDNGSFSIKGDAPASPDIYRLSLGDRFIYFPIDSIETVQITTGAADFGRKFTLSGTENAEKLGAFEKDLMTLSNPDSAALADFKKNVYSRYIKDERGSIVCYYVLTKIYNGAPLYNPANHEDTKYYAAVATQFDQYRPDDPHGKMVKEVSLQAMRARNSAQGKKTVVEAPELQLLEIDLPDENGKNVKLSDVVGKGKPVVVIFSLMNEPESPAFNRELARIYESKKGAVEFYQVSFDAGRYEWREAARNLPWITVIDAAGNESTAARDYNVTGLPAVFIYNAQGALIDRPASLDELKRKI